MPDRETGLQSTGLGKRLKSLRQSLDLTQGDFGEILGISQAYLSDLELGSERPTKRLVKQVVSQFHVREEWLLTGAEPRDVSIEELMAPVLAAIQARGPFALQEIRAILAIAHPTDIAGLPGRRITDPLAVVAELALQELRTARSAHGPMHGRHEGYAVILEELDELWAECKKRSPEAIRLRKEAIQVAAMAMRFVLDVCPVDE
jgi:transcriptional regulator with XRE-family HTH domain